MTIDEQRQAWRAYAAAAMAQGDYENSNHAVSEIRKWANRMLEEERKRFDGADYADHAGDANTKVEPRPFAILTEDDIAETRSGAAKASLWFDGSTTPRIQTEAQVEPRPWVGLTDEEISELTIWFRCSAGAGLLNIEGLLCRADDLLREKNGGTR